MHSLSRALDAHTPRPILGNSKMRNSMPVPTAEALAEGNKDASRSWTATLTSQVVATGAAYGLS